MFRFPTDPAHQAFRILQVAFIVLPIIAGLDKFFYFLDNWSEYLSPFILGVIHQHDRLLMGIVGVVEITAGVGMIFKPKIFAYVVSLWLLLIILVVAQSGEHLDDVLRDFGLMLGALALGRLSQKYGEISA